MRERPPVSGYQKSQSSSHGHHTADLLICEPSSKDLPAWGPRDAHWSPLENQRSIGIEGRPRTVMLNMPDPAAKQVEAQTVGSRFDHVQQSGTQHRPLRWIDGAFEDRELYASAVVLAGASDATQA